MKRLLLTKHNKPEDLWIGLTVAVFGMLLVAPLAELVVFIARNR